MNILYTLFFYILVSTGFSQKLPTENGKLGGILPVDATGLVQYQQVESIGSVSKDELYQRARRWYTQTYKTANSVLQVNDPTTGELAGKGVFFIRPTIVGIPQDCQIDHTISVEVKEGKYRVTINSFYFRAKSIQSPIESIKNTSKGFLRKVYEDTNEQVYILLLSLNKAMKTSKSDF